MSDFGGVISDRLNPTPTPSSNVRFLYSNVQFFEVILGPKFMHVPLDDICKLGFKKAICYTYHFKMQLNIFDAKKIVKLMVV